MIDVPEAPPRRTDRKTCPSCEASAEGCRSNNWLRGRLCCPACEGDHDLPSSRERHPTAEELSPLGAKVASEVSPPAQTGLRGTAPTPTTSTTDERNAR